MDSTKKRSPVSYRILKPEYEHQEQSLYNL